MSPHFILGQESMPCVTEEVNRSLKADCTDYTNQYFVVIPLFIRAMRLLSEMMYKIAEKWLQIHICQLIAIV